jgi:cyclic beta-1,2-glucan synthetase
LLHRHRFSTAPGRVDGLGAQARQALDLNKLLAGEFDAFPIKAGPIEVLRNGIRFVLTLDSDTQLPRGTAAR